MLSLILMNLSSCSTITQITNRMPDPIVNGESVIKINEDLSIVYMPYWYYKKWVEYSIINEENNK